MTATTTTATRVIDYSRRKKQFARSSRRGPESFWRIFIFSPLTRARPPRGPTPAGSASTTPRAATPATPMSPLHSSLPPAAQSISATLIVCARGGGHPSCALRAHPYHRRRRSLLARPFRPPRATDALARLPRLAHASSPAHPDRSADGSLAVWLPGNAALPAGIDARGCIHPASGDLGAASQSREFPRSPEPFGEK
ncbi:hypothetical protein PUN28_007836 [Cardiocondyla obscurior]|uniref:Uncharacterized protein n=1 Tax=Cardiocondyla obscurior TaxID=286306 RepID=A0AAW2FXV3_9HYME